MTDKNGSQMSVICWLSRFYIFSTIKNDFVIFKGRASVKKDVPHEIQMRKTSGIQTSTFCAIQVCFLLVIECLIAVCLELRNLRLANTTWEITCQSYWEMLQNDTQIFWRPWRPKITHISLADSWETCKLCSLSFKCYFAVHF